MPKLKLKRVSDTNTPVKEEKSKIKALTKSETQAKPKYNSLREVMDYTKPLTIFFSGVESEFYLDTLYDLGIRDFLMSYEYLRGKGVSTFKKYKDIRLFIDSGAYTYQNDPKYEEYTEEQWVKQIKEYLEWAKKHKDNIFAIADLDLQYLSNVGYEKVYEWRKTYFEPFMLETGIPVCFIYHEDGLDQWEYMCKRYPYVGLSLAIDKVENGSNQLREMFKIAEKHNALCQGMASTNTKLLTQYPFYTVDSTTWNAGLKYGEISVWTGTKMSRVKKTEFETKAFPIIQKYEGATFDLDLIRAEDKTEMIRVNAYAFVLGEKYVRERLKARMYWFKSRTLKQDITNLPDDFFPTPEWFDGDLSDLKDYAQKMNINPDFAQAYACIYDMTTLLNWDNEEYDSMRNEYLENDGEIISQLHDIYVNRIVPTLEDKVKDLVDFFTECLEGKNDKLLQLGTNFDRIVKERESYISDEEYETIDVSEMELSNTLSKYLPPARDGEAPEISDLDDEIFRENEITPVRDEHGRFLKGQKQVLKPKKLYSAKYPKMACDTCVMAQKCPEYKAGYVCAYSKMFERFDTRDMGDIIQAMQGIVDFSLLRLQRGMMFEMMGGGLPDGNVTAMMNQSMGLLNQLNALYANGSTEVLRQTKVVKSDGTEETTTQVTNPQRGGILEQIFGSMGREESQPKEDIIDQDLGAQDKNK